MGAYESRLTIRVPEDHATIQAALDAALDGDTVLVGAGIYSAGFLPPGKTRREQSGAGEGGDPGDVGIQELQRPQFPKPTTAGPRFSTGDDLPWLIARWLQSFGHDERARGLVAPASQ